MTRSRKQRRARKRLLQQKTAASRQRDAPYPICPDCGRRHAPDIEEDDEVDGDDDVSWSLEDVFYPFPDQAFDQWKDCEESFYLPNGVMLKLFPGKAVIRAPELMRDSKELLCLVCNFLLPHYSDTEQCEFYLTQEVDVVMEFLESLDLEIDIGYWPKE